MALSGLSAAAGGFTALIRNPVGFVLDGPDRRQWRIKSLDADLDLEIVGDFRPRDGLTVDAAASLATSQGVGDQGELVQFLGGASDRCSVTVELFGERPNDDLRSRLDELLLLVRKDAGLRRPPRCRFSWGVEFSRDVLFDRVQTHIVRLWPNGRLAQVAVTLSMIEAAPVTVEVTEPGKPAKESIEVVLRAGETFEMIAARYYGDPLKGVNLRLRHPEILGGVEAAGARVLVVGRDHPDIRAPVRFVSPPLIDGDDLDEVFRDLLAARAQPGVVPAT